MISGKALSLLHKLEDADGRLRHVPHDSPELLELRRLLTTPDPKRVKTNIDTKMLYFYRRYNRITESYMSSLIDVPLSVYLEMESGKRRMSKGQLEVICERLDVDIKMLSRKDDAR